MPWYALPWGMTLSYAKNQMKQVLKISIVSLLLLGFFLTLVHFWGTSRNYPTYDSKFFAGSVAPLKVVPWQQEGFIKDDPSWALWADVYRGEENQIIVMPWIEHGKEVKTLEKKTNPTRPLLADLLKEFPERKFILNIVHNVENIHVQVAKIIDETASENRILLQSPYNVILDSIKQLKPLLTFGSTPADLVRLKSFSALKIVSAAPFKGDAYVGALGIKGVPSLDTEIVNELKRRHKKIILGPIFTKEELATAQSLGADGLFVEDPLILL